MWKSFLQPGRSFFKYFNLSPSKEIKLSIVTPYQM
ncbi:hypothetical protein EVA_18276 [gut metagenome]|uniref:Uncharacterized protein n=1 Tax=gut metagenome TaxID=749906 RepID=J9FFE0_9ZZZZ